MSKSSVNFKFDYDDEFLDKYNDVIHGPNEIIVDKVKYELNKHKKVNAVRFVTKKNDPTLLIALKWTINLKCDKRLEKKSFFPGHS